MSVSCPLGIISRMLSLITDTTPNLAGKLFVITSLKRLKKSAKNQQWEFILSNALAVSFMFDAFNCMPIVCP